MLESTVMAGKHSPLSGPAITAPPSRSSLCNGGRGVTAALTTLTVPLLTGELFKERTSSTILGLNERRGHYTLMFQLYPSPGCPLFETSTAPGVRARLFLCWRRDEVLPRFVLTDFCFRGTDEVN